MWTCKLCHVSFASESIEAHVYNNHLKPNVGCIEVYNCGECMQTAEGFEDIALHCITNGHEPALVFKGLDYDAYVSQLFTALRQTMGLDKQTSRPTSNVPNSVEAASMPISNDKIDWSETDGGFKHVEDINERFKRDYHPATGAEAAEENNNHCGKRFLQRDCLEIHERTHTGVKPYVCSQCGKGFVRRDHLETHEKIHTGVKSFVCSQCGKGFVQRTHLEIHERTHTGVKPYVCSLCGKGFVRRDHLEIHERIHTNEKPYVCSQCGKGFIQRTHLETHERIHSGAKPFRCQTCSKSFARKDALRLHEGRIHARMNRNN